MRTPRARDRRVLTDRRLPGEQGSGRAAAPRQRPNLDGPAAAVRVRVRRRSPSVHPRARPPGLGLHPAQSYAVTHHRDIAAAVRLALTGVMDGRIVNVTDGAPVTIFEMA